MAELKPPIILIGNVRSGTSMTAFCFDQFKDIVIWREPRTVWTMGNAEMGHDRFTEAQATPAVVERIRDAFLKYQEENDGRRVMEKTPSNCLRVPFVQRVFPEAKFIHLVRDGRDNVSSCLQRWSMPINQNRLKRRLKETPVWEWPAYLPRFLHDRLIGPLRGTRRVKSWGVVYPGMYEDLKARELVEVIAIQWVRCIETAQQDLANVDRTRWIECRYEDFVADPQRQFSRFCAHVGLAPTDQVREYLATTIRQDAVQAWRQRLTPEQLALITPILEPTMTRLGYRLDESAAGSGEVA
ncbi:MAG: sulfotransferase [Phycisphaerales bacterium]|nr:sulfotransferase [Phycisphaerales bacterium]